MLPVPGVHPEEVLGLAPAPLGVQLRTWVTMSTLQRPVSFGQVSTRHACDGWPGVMHTSVQFVSIIDAPKEQEHNALFSGNRSFSF